jgi:hypothetical protein
MEKLARPKSRPVNLESGGDINRGHFICGLVEGGMLIPLYFGGKEQNNAGDI